MNDPRNDTLLKLAFLRESLLKFTKPQVLKKIINLQEALGTDKNAFIQQFKFWIQKNGTDCRYAAMAKQFFLEDQATRVAEQINWLYHNWSKFYETK